MAHFSTWKDDEFGYCVELVQTQGNANVPFDAVESYLRVQIVGARQDKRPDVMEALQDLRAEWIRDHGVQS
jgi:hypothetical protein